MTKRKSFPGKVIRIWKHPGVVMISDESGIERQYLQVWLLVLLSANLISNVADVTSEIANDLIEGALGFIAVR